VVAANGDIDVVGASQFGGKNTLNPNSHCEWGSGFATIGRPDSSAKPSEIRGKPCVKIFAAPIFISTQSGAVRTGMMGEPALVRCQTNVISF